MCDTCAETHFHGGRYDCFVLPQIWTLTPNLVAAFKIGVCVRVNGEILQVYDHANCRFVEL